MDEDDEPEIAVVVIDNGTTQTMAGFAGDEAPQVVFPTIVGRPKEDGSTTSDGVWGNTKCYIGDDAQAKRDALSITCPIEYGIIQNWDDMETIWNHTFQQLNVEPKDHPVVLTETALNPNANREKMTQIMFEKFDIPAFYVGMQAFFAIYTTGRLYGVVVDSGEQVTRIVPFYQGYPIPHAIINSDLAGWDLTKHLQKLLSEERRYHFTTSSDLDLETLRDIKKKLCYTSMDFEMDMVETAANANTTNKDDSAPSSIEKSYTLPDGTTITVGNERFRCPEALFQPSLVGRDSAGIHQLIHQSVMACDPDIRDVVAGRVVFSGGSTLFPQLANRLRAELGKLVDYPSSRVATVEAPERRFYSWIGGSMMASMSTFESKSITKQEYEENGPSIVHKKCF